MVMSFNFFKLVLCQRAARMEEEKIRQMQNEKENRLRKFQQQTRYRVNKTNLLKRQQQIQEAEQAVSFLYLIIHSVCNILYRI